MERHYDSACSRRGAAGGAAGWRTAGRAAGIHHPQRKHGADLPCRFVDLCEKIDPADLQVGDPATFVLNEELVVATHRVVDIDTENQCFYTKGDANDAPDASPVHFNNLLGKPVFSIPYWGYVANYIQTPPGMYIAIAAGGVLLLLVFLPDLFDDDKKKRRKSHTRACGGRNE